MLEKAAHPPESAGADWTFKWKVVAPAGVLFMLIALEGKPLYKRCIAPTGTVTSFEVDHHSLKQSINLPSRRLDRVWSADLRRGVSTSLTRDRLEHPAAAIAFLLSWPMNLPVLHEVVSAIKRAPAIVAPTMLVLLVLVCLARVFESLGTNAAHAMLVFPMLTELAARTEIRSMSALEADVVCGGRFTMLEECLGGVEDASAAPAPLMLLGRLVVLVESGRVWEVTVASATELVSHVGRPWA